MQAANLLEQPSGPLKTRGNEIDLDFRPFEIKTLRFVTAHKIVNSKR